MERHGEKMKLRFSGLYDGDEVRAERRGTSWLFQMKCRKLGDREGWYEYSPTGLWVCIGSWPTLDRGLWIAARLRSGSHFYDRTTGLCRPYGEDVYAELRGEAA